MQPEGVNPGKTTNQTQPCGAKEAKIGGRIKTRRGAQAGPRLVPPLEQKKEQSDFPFAVSVSDVYEGPLDLLLDLIRKQDIDIYDIPIAKITAQYLAYVEKLKELDVNVAADFIYMAAVLIHIKSKMLLPRDPDATAASRTIHGRNSSIGCSSTKNSNQRRRCFCRNSRLKMRSGRIRR